VTYFIVLMTAPPSIISGVRIPSHLLFLSLFGSDPYILSCVTIVDSGVG